MELRILQKRAAISGELQSERVAELSQKSMMDVTDNHMQEIAKMTAINAYWEVWIMQHDAVTLAKQAQDILEHPEMYIEREVSPPKKENEGELALQFLKPEGYEPTEEDMIIIRKLANLGPMMEEMIRDNNYVTLDLLVALPNGLMIDIKYGNSGFFAVIREDGTLIYSPRESGELKADNTFKTNIREMGNTQLIDMLDRTAAGEIGFDDVTIDGEEYYCAFGYGITHDWAVFMFVRRQELEQPTQDLLATMNETVKESQKEYQKNFASAAIIFAIVICLLV